MFFYFTTKCLEKSVELYAVTMDQNTLLVLLPADR